MPSDMAATHPLPELILYSRPGCGLCDEARAIVQGLLEDRAARSQPLARLREQDITVDPALERAYFDRIPVVEINGRTLELAISTAQLRRFLADQLDTVRA
jgi:hypothetical protein